MLTREQLAAEIVRTSGRGKNQAAAVAESLPAESIERISAAVASKADVGAAIDAELNAIADARVVGPPMPGAPRLASSPVVAPL